MFKFLGKLRWWKKDSKNFSVHEYGRYVHKPIRQRALSCVMGISQGDLVNLVRQTQVELNGTPLDVTHLVLRMESGSYEIKIPSQNRIWRFFIA